MGSSAVVRHNKRAARLGRAVQWSRMSYYDPDRSGALRDQFVALRMARIARAVRESLKRLTVN